MLVDQQNDRPQPIRHYYDTTRQVHAESKTRRIWGLMSGCEGLKGTGGSRRHESPGIRVPGLRMDDSTCIPSLLQQYGNGIMRTIVVAYVGRAGSDGLQNRLTILTISIIKIRVAPYRIVLLQILV